MDVKFLLCFILLRFISCEPLRGRIVGGTKADQYQFPYQVAIRDSSKNFICSGFVINEFYIGTSAFCVKDYQPYQIEALLGTTQISRGGGGWIYRIIQINIHYAFDVALQLNDVAVIKPNVKISFTYRVKPIELSSDYLNQDETVTISGYGKNSHLNDGVSDNLHFIYKQVISNDNCYSRLLQNGENANVVFNNKFCTFNGVGEGTCSGDIGSPITLNDQLVGIVSWDRFCGLGSPDVHTRISNFRSWFIDNTQQE